MREIRLPLPPFDYRFDLLLEFARRIAYPARLLVQGDTLWRFTASQALSHRLDAEAIVIAGPDLKPEDEPGIARASIDWLGLERDQSAFCAVAARHPPLWQVIEPLRGLPLFCAETVFEALITLVIEQHISWKGALRAQQVLLRAFGRSRSIGGGRVYDFPAPGQLAAARRDQLKQLKITNRRVDMIMEIAKAEASGALKLESLRQLPAQIAYERLMRIKGVGHWTANNALGRAFGLYPLLSHNDVALQAAVAHYFDANEKSAASVNAALGGLGAFAGLAGHYVLLRWVLDRYPAQSSA